MFSSAKTSAPKSGASPATLSKSLRLRSSASASLRRTFSTSGTNNKIRTISTWVKRGILGTVQVIMGGDDGGANQSRLLFQTDDTLNLRLGGSASNDNVTTAVFRDPSAWYHIVALIDTTQATAANRAKIYVNGVQQTIPSPTSIQNQTTAFANPSASNTIGEVGGTGSSYLDGYLTDFYFIDGQALTPSSFGVTNATTGQWSPATYSGTYGTNGFHLTFANTTSTTTLGYDTSGNSNNWTTNNISLTAGSTYDSMNDVPVAYSATAANYSVINPLLGNATKPINGNLTWNRATLASYESILSTFGVTSGKWYIEFVPSSFDAAGIGITTSPTIFTTYPGGTSNLWWMYDNGASNIIWNQSSSNVATTRYASGQTWQIALDMNTGVCWIGINNTFYNSTNTGTGNPSTGSNPTFSSLPTSSPMFIFIQSYDTNWSANFGQQPFTYTPPTGFVALNTYNLPTPSIAQGNKYMDATLYTGTGASQSITNAGSFKPDLVWIKSRSAATDHKLTDSVRGVTKALVSNSTAAETTDTQGLTAFNSNGFTLGTDTNYNNTSATYVGWQWQAGAGSSSSNTNGSITSTVSANTTSGFSIVTYTGSGSNATVGHGLGVAPSMIIGKARNSVVDWRVYHTSIGAANFLVINTTDASASGATWNSTTPTSTVFTVGGGSNMNVNSSTTYVAYCFAPVTGFSAFGSYTGNGSTSGPFIYTGFQPRYVMFKRTDTAGYSWFIWDTVRFIYNSNGAYLLANSSGSESPYTGINVLSNGFQLVNSVADFNASGGTYIYMAFASNPFAYSNAF